jgi:predicted DNA-binding transcriptional regulator YafY
MNRIDRLSAILIQLQTRKNTRAMDIAERFEISLRTVYRDIRSLEEAGVPIIGEAGIGYSLADGYRLPPVMFTREEATAFITAEKLVKTLTDQANSTHYSMALDKIRAVLRSTDKDYLEKLDDRIKVIKSKRHPGIQKQENPLQVILDALSRKLVMELDYFVYYRQEYTSRKVEPIGVFYLDNYWHLIAYCKERAACRDFRFDRIKNIRPTEEVFIDNHKSLQNYLSEQYKDLQLIDVTILVDDAAYLHLGEQKFYQGFIKEQKTSEGVVMNFMTLSMEGFARWYMTFADYALILEPQSLKDRVHSLFLAIEKKINPPKPC